MSTSVKVTEYYDCFDVKTELTYPDTRAITTAQNTALPNTDNTFLNKANNFRGFNNFAQDDKFNIMTGDNTNSGLLSSVHNLGSAFTPPSTSTATDGVPLASDLITITGKHKAPQAINNISIDDAGNILCYPPNISVPYWDRIIFKHFDYDINPATNYNGPYKPVIDSYLNTYHNVSYPTVQWRVDNDALSKTNPPMTIPIPDYYWDIDLSGSATVPRPFRYDFSDVTGSDNDYTIRDYRNVPVFIKYDMYPSRSKVVYSSADKWNQNSSDIVHKFNYHHGQMEPVKLAITLSASNPATNPNDSTERYNQQLKYTDIQQLFKKCYWSIEWIYDRTTGN